MEWLGRNTKTELTWLPIDRHLCCVPSSLSVIEYLDFLSLSPSLEASWYSVMMISTTPLLFKYSPNSKLVNAVPLPVTVVFGRPCIAINYWTFLLFPLWWSWSRLWSPAIWSEHRSWFRNILPINGLAKSKCRQNQGLSGHSQGCSRASAGNFVVAYSLYSVVLFVQCHCPFLATTQLCPSECI